MQPEMETSYRRLNNLPAPDAKSELRSRSRNQDGWRGAWADWRGRAGLLGYRAVVADVALNFFVLEHGHCRKNCGNTGEDRAQARKDHLCHLNGNI